MWEMNLLTTSAPFMAVTKPQSSTFFSKLIKDFANQIVRAHSAPREIGNCCHPDKVAARNLDLTPTGKPANPGYDRHGNPLGPGWPESFPGVQFHPTRGKVISCEKDIAGDQLRNRNAGATKLLSAPHPDTTIASLERPSPFGCGTSCGGLALFFNVRRAPRFCTPITNARAPTQHTRLHVSNNRWCHVQLGAAWRCATAIWWPRTQTTHANHPQKQTTRL